MLSDLRENFRVIKTRVENKFGNALHEQDQINHNTIAELFTAFADQLDSGINSANSDAIECGNHEIYLTFLWRAILVYFAKCEEKEQAQTGSFTRFL